MGVQVNLITGITGQDGILLSKLLIRKQERIVGLISRRSNVERINLVRNLSPQVTLVETTSNTVQEFERIVEAHRPSRVFNFAAVSSVRESFEQPELTHQVNFEMFKNLCEATFSKSQTPVKIFQSSSSEMFGNSELEIQDELTPLNPISPYGESKALAHQLAAEYRKNGHFVSTGILFNHESEYRKKGFLTEKIVSYVHERSKGQRGKLELGTLDVSRDWGYAGDFVRGIESATNYKAPEDFVFATGKQRTILELIQTCLDIIDDETPISEIVSVNHFLARSSEKFSSQGNYVKAKELLNWEPEISFEQMLRIMIAAKSEQSK